MFAEYKISMQAGFGEAFASVTEVGQSFDQAKQALEYAVYLNKKGILWSHETQSTNTTYYYPLDTEHRLISTIRAGELEEAQKIIDSIIAQNLEQRELSVEMKNQLVGEIKGTFLKLLDQKIFLESPLFESVKQRIIDISPTVPLETIQQDIHGIMEELCGFIAKKKKDSHAQLIKQIYQYTAEAYADPDLTLYRGSPGQRRTFLSSTVTLAVRRRLRKCCCKAGRAATSAFFRRFRRLGRRDG